MCIRDSSEATCHVYALQTLRSVLLHPNSSIPPQPHARTHGPTCTIPLRWRSPRCIAQQLCLSCAQQSFWPSTVGMQGVKRCSSRQPPAQAHCRSLPLARPSCTAHSASAKHTKFGRTCGMLLVPEVPTVGDQHINICLVQRIQYTACMQIANRNDPFTPRCPDSQKPKRRTFESFESISSLV